MITTIPVHQGPRPVWLDRTIAAAIVAIAAALAMFLFAAQPDAKGYDTHTQFGLSPCSWPRDHGMPCPTCGATTAACLLVHGRPLQAVATQPFGAAVTAAGLWFAAIAAYCLVRSRSFLDVYVQLPRARLLLIGIVLLLASWGYKCATFASR